MMELVQLLQTNAVAFYGVVAFVGLFVGSFLNVVIHRLPIMMENAWREGLLELEAELAVAVGETPDISATTSAQVRTTNSDPSAEQVHEETASARTSAQVSAENVPAGTPPTGTGAHFPPENVPAGTPIENQTPFNLAVPRSRCPNCGQLISWWQNIPVLSYLLLRAKCHACKAHIPVRYPLVELITMLLSLVVAWQLGPSPQALLGIVVTWYLVAMSMIDFDHHLLPDSLTLPLLWIGLLASLLPVFAEVHDAVVGAALGYGTLWSVYWAFKLVTGKEGMGFGDFKLLAALGALLGWQVLPMVILLSSLVGAIVGLALIAITGRDKNIPIPFGPYLAAAGWIAMLWGDSLAMSYSAMFAL